MKKMNFSRYVLYLGTVSLLAVSCGDGKYTPGDESNYLGVNVYFEETEPYRSLPLDVYEITFRLERDDAPREDENVPLHFSCAFPEAYGKAVVDKTTFKSDETLTVTVPITNTGKREGAEVVQLYIRDVKSALPRPVKELKGFKKIRLMPGETCEVTFTIDKEALSYFDDTRHEWVAEPGKFEAIIAASAIDVRSKVTFTLSDNH